MKKKLSFLLTAFIAIAFTMNVQAKIWRVNNNGFSANFASLQLANDNPNVGVNPLIADTIHLEGSNNVYGSATITKKLVIVGGGYFLAENATTSSNQLETKLAWITFSETSSGSQLIGVWVYTSNGISINASNIIIKRCKIDDNINLRNDLTNIKILENFFTNDNSVTAVDANSNGFPTDVVINNNIFKKPLFIQPYNPSFVVAECKNNIFAYSASGLGIQMYVASFENNILTNPNATVNINGGNFNNVRYNVSASTNNQFGTANNNIVVPDFSTWFVSILTAASTDKDYQLQSGTTPGSDGTDRGAFGGAAVTNRYALSGLAPVPVIYQVTTSGVATPAGVLPVTIKARTIQ